MGYLSQFDASVMRMFNKFAGDATILVEGAGTYDPNASDYVSNDYSYPVRVVLLDFTNKKDGLGEIRDTLVQEGDKRCLIQPPEKAGNPQQAPIQPNKDKIQIGNAIYKIITYKDLNPSGTNSVLYEMYIRGN